MAGLGGPGVSLEHARVQPNRGPSWLNSRRSGRPPSATAPSPELATGGELERVPGRGLPWATAGGSPAPSLSDSLSCACWPAVLDDAILVAPLLGEAHQARRPEEAREAGVPCRLLREGAVERLEPEHGFLERANANNTPVRKGPQGQPKQLDPFGKGGGLWRRPSRLLALLPRLRWRILRMIVGGKRRTRAPTLLRLGRHRSLPFSLDNGY